MPAKAAEPCTTPILIPGCREQDGSSIASFSLLRWQAWPCWQGPTTRPRKRRKRASKTHKCCCSNFRSSQTVQAIPKKWWPVYGRDAIVQTPACCVCLAQRICWSNGARAAGKCAPMQQKRPGGDRCIQSYGSAAKMHSIKSCCDKSAGHCCRAPISEQSVQCWPIDNRLTRSEAKAKVGARKAGLLAWWRYFPIQSSMCYALPTL